MCGVFDERFVVTIEWSVLPCKRIYIWRMVIDNSSTNFESNFHSIIESNFPHLFLFQRGSVSLLGETFSRKQSSKLQFLWINSLLYLVPQNHHGGIVQIFVNTFHRWLKHIHWTLSILPDAIWQLSANQLHQMLICSKRSTGAVIVLSEEVYTFDMDCTVTLTRILSKYWTLGVYDIEYYQVLSK